MSRAPMQAEDLIKLAKKGKLDQLESEWMTVVADGAARLDELQAVVRLLADRGHGELAESLTWYLVDALRERGEPERALRAARRGAALLPLSGVVRQLTADLYVEVHGDREGMAELVRATLRDPAIPLDEGIVAIERMTSLVPGTYVLDRRRGTAGRVQGLDLEQGGLLVETERGVRVYGPGLVAQLEPAEEDDFRALCVFERERLVEMAAQEPEELVRLVLATLDRRMELRRLKLYLAPLVGPWAKWWSGAREKLKRSAAIGMTAGRSPSLFLRARPLSHSERLVRRFDSLAGHAERLAMALLILGEADQHGRVDEDALQHVAAEVAGLAGAGPDAPLKVAAAAVRRSMEAGGGARGGGAPGGGRPPRRGRPPPRRRTPRAPRP